MSATAAVSRTLALIEALAGNVLDGMRLAQLAEQLGQSPPTTLRDLQALESLGYAERIPGRSDCWRLTARLCRLANAHREEMARHRQRLDDIDRNFTLPPTTR
jgi:DNA-binding IclR family transcriptional regulator